MTTAYHAKYFAHFITRQGGNGIDRISRSLFDATVDLNPNQIDAAQFAIRSPISKGVLLADEVGLGKTIEAGLVLCQYWAEQRRKMLVICPASIRKQWALELEEKFNLPTTILDNKTYGEVKRNSGNSPFESNKVVITSIHFASAKANEIQKINWDMVIVDEAHKLRNAYRPSNRMGQNIRFAIENRRKILMTATPLQNSLLELYGLATLIDDRIFGDLPSFRTQFINTGGDLEGLRNRLRSFCLRTLRRQVLEYIKYTERLPMTRPFSPNEQEQKLYEAVSAFLQRDDTYALPQKQRHLTIMIARKLLASSPRAVAGTLEAMRERLISIRDGLPTEENMAKRLVEEEEIEEEILDEILGEDGDEKEDDEETKVAEQDDIDRSKLQAEIDELERYIAWARGIGVDTKALDLLKALKIGFEQMTDMGARCKAVIFSESRRTQSYLRDFLEANGYAGKVVLFNGTNSDAESTQIYLRWKKKNQDNGRATGSRDVDIRAALIEHFQESASILIATEAAAEGINLQFCSLVVNFDLPWNPQRIEQRIGRCHRYGQKHDVVVINFLNQRNAADLRVYELLESKFKLFSGVFGASDDVLGSVESGVDFERRILDIYQKCRSTEEIEAEFAALRIELDEQIKTRIDETRRKLLENFDEDVHARLKINMDGARETLDRVGRMFWRLSKHILSKRAYFDDAELAFDLNEAPIPNIRHGRYRLISKNHQDIPNEFLYRLSHPLGEYVLESGKACSTPLAKVEFNVSRHPARIAVVEKLKGKSGWLIAKRLLIESFEREEYLLFSAFTDDGTDLDQETCDKLFYCDGNATPCNSMTTAVEDKLKKEAERHIKSTVSRSLEENNRHFQEARERLEAWADDLVLASEKELYNIKEQIKVLKREARQASTLGEQHELQLKIKELEKKQRRQRQQIFNVEDEIMAKRDRLIEGLERRMAQKIVDETLFAIRWTVV